MEDNQGSTNLFYSPIEKEVPSLTECCKISSAMKKFLDGVLEWGL